MNSDEIFVLADEQYDLGNFENAFALFVDAAELGDSGAMSRLACMCADGEGITQSYEKSLEWDLKAIELGEPSSMLNIGITYRGLGDLKAARQWFEKSLANGDGEAALALAKLYTASDNEDENIRHYLNIAAAHDSICELSREEAKELLSQFR